METKLEKQKAGCDIAVFTKNAYASEIQLNVAVKPWEPREIPTHSSVFPAGHVQSIPSLKSSPQQALDYEKSPAGASHMQETHPFPTTSDASPLRCGRLKIYSRYTGVLPAWDGKIGSIQLWLYAADQML